MKNTLVLLAIVLACHPARLEAASKSDIAALKEILAPSEQVDRAALTAKLSDAGLRDRVEKTLPEIAKAAERYRRTQKLLADVKAVGGNVELAPGGPEWLREAAGDEAMKIFDAPVSILLYDGNNPLKGKGGLNTRVNDAWLQRIEGLATVTKLDLANCDVHLEGMRRVATLTGLESLNLTLAPVTDEALAPLAALTELRVLSLASTPCTGEGFKYLKPLKKLENLNMHHAETNDAGLAAIAQVGNLERLWIAHTHFTDAGSKHLAAHKNLNRLGIGSKMPAGSGKTISAVTELPLTELQLFDGQATDEGVMYAANIPTLRLLNVAYGPTVTDAAMEAIAKMPALEELLLNGTKITDAGLTKLAGIKTLRGVTVTGSKGLSEEAVAQLRKARPDVNVQVK